MNKLERLIIRRHVNRLRALVAHLGEKVRVGARVCGTFDPHAMMKVELYQSADSGMSVCSPQVCGLADGRSQYQS